MFYESERPRGGGVLLYRRDRPQDVARGPGVTPVLLPGTLPEEDREWKHYYRFHNPDGRTDVKGLMGMIKLGKAAPQMRAKRHRDKD